MLTHYHSHVTCYQVGVSVSTNRASPVIPTRAPCLMSHIANWTNTRHSPVQCSVTRPDKVSHVVSRLAHRHPPPLPVHEALFPADVCHPPISDVSW